MQRIALRAAPIAAAVWLALSASAAESEPKAAAAAVDPAAVAVVQRAGDVLRAAEAFSFTAVTSYDVVQDDGMKLEFGATRHYLVRRPDRVRIEVQPRSGGDRVVVFDGDRLTIAEPKAKTYAQLRTKQHRSIDETIVLLREVLGVPVPLGELLLRDPRPELVSSLTEAFRVGTALVDGVECDQVALRSAERDAQLWITRGDAPVLRRVVIAYRKEPGEPSFTASLDRWSLAANAPDEMFRYAPPADFERVRFALPQDAVAKQPPEAP